MPASESSDPLEFLKPSWHACLARLLVPAPGIKGLLLRGLNALGPVTSRLRREQLLPCGPPSQRRRASTSRPFNSFSRISVCCADSVDADAVVLVLHAC